MDVVVVVEVVSTCNYRQHLKLYPRVRELEVNNHALQSRLKELQVRAGDGLAGLWESHNGTGWVLDQG